jgi:hypothetical protein
MPDEPLSEYSNRRSRIADLERRVNQSASDYSTGANYADETFQYSPEGSPKVRQSIAGRRAVGPQVNTSETPVTSDEYANPGEQVTIPSNYQGENRDIIVQTLGARPIAQSTRGGVAGTWDRMRAASQQAISSWWNSW